MSTTRERPAFRRRLPFLVALLAAGPIGLGSSGATVGMDPNPPKDLKAEVLGPHAVRLTWKQGGGSDPSLYLVYRDGEYVGPADVDEREYVDEGLSPWTEYTYRVVAVDNRWRSSDPSAPVTVRTDDASGPGAPAGLTATAIGPNAVELSWEAAIDPESGIAGYIIRRDGGRAGETEELSFVDDGLQPDTDYEYRVRAVNGSGLTGPNTEPVFVRTPPLPDTTPPAPPVSLRVVQP